MPACRGSCSLTPELCCRLQNGIVIFELMQAWFQRRCSYTSPQYLILIMIPARQARHQAVTNKAICGHAMPAACLLIIMMLILGLSARDDTTEVRVYRPYIAFTAAALSMSEKVRLACSVLRARSHTQFKSRYRASLCWAHGMWLRWFSLCCCACILVIIRLSRLCPRRCCGWWAPWSEVPWGE
jgi:hypothetical protein